MWSVDNYWPWWLSALALAVVAVGFFLFERRMLGVSGSFGRLSSAIERPDLERNRAAIARNPDAFQAALLAATLKEFGDELPVASPTVAAAPELIPAPGPAPWTAHLTFVLCLSLGGAIASVLRHGWRLEFSMGKAFETVVGTGWVGIAVLVFGGALTGFGTQMAGGCTSGHGLTGCARGQRGSLLTTAAFFGTAVLLSIGWQWVRG